MAEEGTPANAPTGDAGFFSPAPSDILKDVVAYVEVRTANDNRSIAVKRVLERMGARVEEKFSDDVTHVIFKEGKKRTRDKAQKLGAHLVSVLWVDSCKENQKRVPEHNFSANTERCSTPPPGVRWKKYKSMQPRDFEDEVARSTERCQKRRRRIDNQRQLLQGGSADTPYHSPAHVLVVDTQPRSPFPALAFNSPVIIPVTPPSMQARLDQMRREKEARMQGEMKESPLCRDTTQDLPLQRTLFASQTPTEKQDASTKSRSTRRSMQLSHQADKNVLPEEAETSPSARQVNLSTGSQSSVSKTSTVSKPASQIKFSGSSESAESDLDETKKSRTKSKPEASFLCNKSFLETSVVLERMDSRRSKGSRLPHTASSSSSHGDMQSSQNLQRNQEVQKYVSKVRAHPSLGSDAPRTSGDAGVSAGSERQEFHDSLQDECEEESSSRDDEGSETSSSVRKRKRKRSSCSEKQKSRKGNSTSKTKRSNNSSTVHSALEQSNITKCLTTSKAKVASTCKPASKKRKLLNPSQEMQILSPSPTDSQNLPNSNSEYEMNEKRGKKRSCDVDSAFPSSFPATKRRCRPAQSKENQISRRNVSQTDPSLSEDSVPETDSGTTGRKQRPAKSRKPSQEMLKDQSASVSTLCSTSHTSSILGSSMSMIFNNTSTSASKRFAPPRNSIAEFKTQKPRRKSRLASSQAGVRGGSRDLGAEQAKLMSLQKFHLSCMPSLVMTSLHRQEQEFVIAAVKKLGVFRLEDKVSKDTTHVVYGEPRRTLNILHGLSRGCWLVSKEWIVRSLEEGQWLTEEEFEAEEDFPKARETRLAREAEAPGVYQCHIFETVGYLFVSNTCTPPRPQLLKLLRLCGAKVTDSLQRADFYVGDEIHDEKNCIKPVWVLDCISRQELLPMDDYILAINFKARSTGSPEF